MTLTEKLIKGNEKTMKVVAFNGSPRKNGNTYSALRLVLEELEKEGIETEIVQVGGNTVKGCNGCGNCARNKDEKCIITGDNVNEWIQKIKHAQGVLFGSPVHYASITGDMKGFLDRAFYVQGCNNRMFRHKTGAALVAVRRSGGTTTFDQLNKYLTCSEMLIPTSNYWNIIHGSKPGEVLEDTEGVQIMRLLGKNMAWLLKLVENGRGVVDEPEVEDKIFMSFIR
jgi:multimeric flavodoxin WrbA